MLYKIYKNTFIIFAFVLLSVSARSEPVITEILNKIARAKDDTNKTNLYRDAIAYYKDTNLDSAYKMAEMGLKVAVKIRSLPAEAYMLSQIGYIDQLQGRMVTAKVRFDNALDIYQKLGWERNVAIVKNELGVIEGIKGNFEQATKMFFDALKMYEKLGDTLGMGQTYIKLGVVNEELNILDKAGDYYAKAFNLSKAIGDSVNMAYLYNNMGINEGKRENYKQAFQCFLDGLAICKSGKNTGNRYNSVKISLLLNYGIAYAHIDDERNALAKFDTALKIARDNHLEFDVPNLLLNEALLDHVVNTAQKLPLLEEALQIAKKTDQKGLESKIYRTLADVYFESGDYKNAYFYADTCNNLEKSIFTVQKNTEIVNLEALYELDKSRNKVASLELQAVKRNYQSNLFIVIAAIITVALIVVIVIYRKTILLNAELKKGKEQLAVANQVKDKMFSVLGHDLRTPVNTILGMLNILQGDNNTMTRKEEQEVFKMLRDQSQVSLDTLNKLLLWGSRQIKGINVQLENFKVNEIIDSNIRLLQENAHEKQIELVNNVPADTSIFSDSSHFDFITRNLLSNAIKFSGNSGKVEIGITATKEEGFVCFYVSDQGIGIKPELKEQIFSINSLSQPGTEMEKGTGLGLLLCRDFVEQDGGRIWVESETGKGAVFYFMMKKND